MLFRSTLVYPAKVVIREVQRASGQYNPTRHHPLATQQLWLEELGCLGRAMAAGLADYAWSVEDIVRVADTDMPKISKRGPYKKRISS